jgi:glycosyltransferase involved in cell wall biosynthesis
MKREDRVKILEITSYPPPRAGWGVRVEHVKRELERMGHECQVLNIGKSRHLESTEFVGVRNGLDYCWKVLRFCLQGFTVHMHVNGDSPKGFVLSLLAQAIGCLTGRRPFLTFHAGPDQRYFPQSRSRLLVPVFKLMFLMSRTIICNSQVVKDRIVGYGVPAGKVVPIPAFSRQYLQYHPAALDARVEEFFRSHDPVVCSYVFFREEFFIESMIQAVGLLAKRFPRFGLIIMGSDQGSEPIHALIRDLGLDDHVLICGDQPHDEFMTIMARSLIYVRTPKRDGVCSSVLEALSLRVPVVASENGTRPAGVVTFTNDDAQDLAASVGYVLDHHDTIRRALVTPDVRDTVAEEASLLAGEDVAVGTVGA